MEQFVQEVKARYTRQARQLHGAAVQHTSEGPTLYACVKRPRRVLHSGREDLAERAKSVRSIFTPGVHWRKQQRQRHAE